LGYTLPSGNIPQIGDWINRMRRI